MKKSNFCILVFIASLIMNIISMLGIQIQYNIGACCLKDYMIYTMCELFIWTMIPCILLVVVSYISSSINMNRVVRYVKIRNLYIHIVLDLFLISIISGILTTISIVISGILFLKLPFDNWNMEESYVMNMYGDKHSDISLLILGFAVIGSVIFVVYVLSCICMIIYRIFGSLYMGFLSGMILTVIELGNIKLPIILHYGALSLSIYITGINIVNTFIISIFIMLVLTFIVCFMGHGDFIKRKIR